MFSPLVKTACSLLCLKSAATHTTRSCQNVQGNVCFALARWFPLLQRGVGSSEDWAVDITGALYLHNSLCISLLLCLSFSPPLSTSVSISVPLPPTHTPSCPAVSSFCFGRRKELGQALYRTSPFALNTHLLKFFFSVLPNICWLGKKKRKGSRGVPLLAHMILNLFSLRSASGVPTQVSRESPWQVN